MAAEPGSLVGVTGGGAIVLGEPISRMPSAYELAMLAFTGRAHGRATCAALLGIRGVRMADSLCYVLAPEVPNIDVRMTFLCLDHLNAHAINGSLTMRGLPAHDQQCDECNEHARDARVAA